MGKNREMIRYQKKENDKTTKQVSIQNKCVTGNIVKMLKNSGGTVRERKQNVKKNWSRYCRLLQFQSFAFLVRLGPFKIVKGEKKKKKPVDLRVLSLSLSLFFRAFCISVCLPRECLCMQLFFVLCLIQIQTPIKITSKSCCSCCWEWSQRVKKQLNKQRSSEQRAEPERKKEDQKNHDDENGNDNERNDGKKK